MKALDRSGKVVDHGSMAARARAFFEARPAVRFVDGMLIDLNGIPRGKRFAAAEIASACSDGILLPGSVFGTDITGATVEATGLGLERGDRDHVCRPVPGSLRPIPWREDAAQLMLAMTGEDGAPFFADPRQVLGRVLDRFAALRLRPVVALELEFYLLDRERDAGGRPQPPRSPVSGERDRDTQVYGIVELDDYRAFIDTVDAWCAAQDVPANSAVAEYAPGQFEINLDHGADPAAACDHAVLLKRTVRQAAVQHGFDATFMAKPYAGLTGNGAHLHVSLVDSDGRNVFAGTSPEDSPTLRHAIGGVLATMAEGMALFAPGVNSFRRFQPDSYAPMSANWSVNNRSTAVRVPAGPDHARRIEHRVAGADANPWLLMAAVLAGIHHGIVNRIEPVPPMTGNAYAQPQPTLPIEWLDALRALEHATVLPDYLGAGFCRVYLACKESERRLFKRHVSALEYDWYLRRA